MQNNPPELRDIVWEPDPDRAAQTHMYRFMQLASAASGQAFTTYAELHHWSVTESAEFWSTFADYAGVRFSQPASQPLMHSETMLSARWFPGARLNFAEHLLAGPGEQIVLVGVDELGQRQELSRNNLRSQTASLAAELRHMGVQPGDRVAALLPNCPEAVVAFLACASIGAVFSSCSPDFGVRGVVDRFGQIEPVVLFACDGYHYAGKRIDCLERLTELQSALPSLRSTVVVVKLGVEPTPGVVPFDSLVNNSAAAVYTQLDFDHPLAILYSSGTTGKPKCIVHGAGGTLLQHLKELLQHTDVTADDTLFYFTTCGWMMWNWLVSGLATGAKLVLYDGSPSYPGIERLWRLAADESITVFGTSPTYLSACEKSGLDIERDFSLSALRNILSTGSPLSPHSFDYIADQFSRRVPISSISGGTDIISCFALGNPLLPVYRGELQCVGLGMAVAVYDSNGNSVKGESGELVCSKAFPSMPVGFWDDREHEKYLAAYFSRFPGIWAHGDIAELTANGGLIIHGRSDAVLNPSGVRIGTAEIYHPVLQLSAVDDCVAIGQEWQGDVRVVLFVVLTGVATLNDALAEQIRTAVRTVASPRHVPAKILQVAEIPRTRSGKIVELAVRAAVHGKPIDNIEAIANPDALDGFRDRQELA